MKKILPITRLVCHWAVSGDGKQLVGVFKGAFIHSFKTEHGLWGRQYTGSVYKIIIAIGLNEHNTRHSKL